MSMKLVRLQERLSWLGKFLTQDRLDEAVNHASRVKLLEEAEQIELDIKELVSMDCEKCHANCY